MEKTHNTNKYAVPAVCAGVLLLAVAVVLGAVFYPGIMARRELNKLREAVAGGVTAVLISNPKLTGYEQDTAGEWLLEGEEASRYAGRLCAALDGARFLHRRDADGGSWDIRVRLTLTGGDTETVFICEDGSGIYFVRGITRFYFSATDIPEITDGAGTTN